MHLEFSEGGIREIARIATEVNDQVENIGARRLHTIMTNLLEEVLFDASERTREGPTSVVVDEALVQQRLASVVRNRDLSRYIL